MAVIKFLISQTGKIVKETLPINTDEEIESASTLLPIEYDWDLIKNMINPIYDFDAKVFIDEAYLINEKRNYLIGEMNRIPDGQIIKKENARKKAFYWLRALTMFRYYQFRLKFEMYDRLHTLVNPYISADDLTYNRDPRNHYLNEDLPAFTNMLSSLQQIRNGTAEQLSLFYTGYRLSRSPRGIWANNTIADYTDLTEEEKKLLKHIYKLTIVGLT